MMKRLSLAALAVLISCNPPVSVSTPTPPPAPQQTPLPTTNDVRATATINDVSNSRIGNASFTDTPAGLLVSITVTGLGIGSHGAHLHTVGTCTTPTFGSAGAHFNPTGKMHGFKNAAGHHAGDMPNIISPPAGSHSVHYIIEGLKLTGRGGLLDDDGASIVIHTGEDDYLTDPAGDSGGRYACGVITLVK